MVGQRAAQAGAGDDVPEAEGPDTVQRVRGVGTEGFRCGVGDLLDRHQRHRGQVPELVQFQEFLGAAHDGGLQAVPVGLFFQVEGVPGAGDGLDRRVVVGAVQERQGPGFRLRVGVQQLDPPPVPGRVHVGRHERVRRVTGCTRRVPVEQFPFLVVERAQPVRHPPQVQRQVLPLTGAVPPEISDRNSFRHQCDPAHGGQRPRAFQDGVLPGEGHRPAGRMRRSARPWPGPGRVPGPGPARHRRSAVRPAPAGSVRRSPWPGPGFVVSLLVTALRPFLMPTPGWLPGRIRG